MALTIGSVIPKLEVTTKTSEGLDVIDTQAYFAGRKIIVFSVPGAFTPTCSEKHFPGYLELIDEFKLAGIDAIACLAVNDAHVMLAWAEQQGADGLIDLFADIRFKFSDILGITADLGPVLGIRASRSAFIVDNGIITHFFKEVPKAFEVSDAKSLLSIVSG